MTKEAYLFKINLENITNKLLFGMGDINEHAEDAK